MGWKSQVHRGVPGKFESTNLSRNNLSREIGLTPQGDPKRGTRKIGSLLSDFKWTEECLLGRFVGRIPVVRIPLWGTVSHVQVFW